MFTVLFLKLLKKRVKVKLISLTRLCRVSVFVINSSFSLLFHVWISSRDAVWSYQVRNCFHFDKNTESRPSVCWGGAEPNLIAAAD